MPTTYFNNAGVITTVSDPAAIFLLGTGSNDYGTALVATGAAYVTLVTRAIPAGKKLNILGLAAWGDTDADYIIEYDDGINPIVNKGGTRTSASKLEAALTYGSPIPLPGPAIVTVRARHFSTDSVDLSCNLTAAESVLS